jgi:hypothetical protein
MTRPLTIAIAPSMSRYFEEIIADAMRVRHIQATEAASRYLVGILCDYAHPDEEAGSPFTKPLTFLLRDALDAIGAERFRKLRALGDGVLYALGFFGGHIELRGVDRKYVVGVGSAAYSHASAMLRIGTPQESPGTDVLGELTQKFDRFAEVLADVAEGTLACSARDQRSLVKLYERWLRTGSSRLAEELGSHGIIPVRGKGGLN